MKPVRQARQRLQKLQGLAQAEDQRMFVFLQREQPFIPGHEIMGPGRFEKMKDRNVLEIREINTSGLLRNIPENGSNFKKAHKLIRQRVRIPKLLSETALELIQNVAGQNHFVIFHAPP